MCATTDNITTELFLSHEAKKTLLSNIHLQSIGSTVPYALKVLLYLSFEGVANVSNIHFQSIGSTVIKL